MEYAPRSASHSADSTWTISGTGPWLWRAENLARASRGATSANAPNGKPAPVARAVRSCETATVPADLRAVRLQTCRNQTTQTFKSATRKVVGGLLAGSDELANSPELIRRHLRGDEIFVGQAKERRERYQVSCASRPGLEARRQCRRDRRGVPVIHPGIMTWFSIERSPHRRAR
jgi:hypothetical protein